MGEAVADRIELTLNGEAVRVAADVHPATTLLRWLREERGLVGTKEGCAEGDCGACTVGLERADGGRVPVNACLAALGQLHGARVWTVEGLLGSHPVQAALAAGNATQCGFCTPGFVMAAWAYAREGGDVHDALAGNLCRCTGYRPIVDVVRALPAEAPGPGFAAAGPARFVGEGWRFERPVTLAALVALRAARPGAWLLAGGTDLGLALADGTALPGDVICTLGVAELLAVEAAPEGLIVGAAASYEALMAAVEGAPELGLGGLLPLLARLGSRQIRGLGTLGGNLGTASPIGDMLPPLLALGARVRLASLEGEREMAVEDFLRGYRAHALGAGEVIRSVLLPLVPAGASFRCEKVSKRYDQDIATASMALLQGPGVVRLAVGGMGAMAARLTRVEAAIGAGDWAAAEAALAAETTPMSDLRGSAAYRAAAARGMLRRLLDGPAVDALQRLEPV